MFNIQALFGIHVSGNEEEKIAEGKCRENEIREKRSGGENGLGGG